MREGLNKITVTSLTSEMKDVPVCSRGFSMYELPYCSKFLKVQFLFFIYLSSMNTSAFDLTQFFPCLCLLPQLYLLFLNLTAPFLIQMMLLIRGSSIQHLDVENRKKLLPQLGRYYSHFPRNNTFVCRQVFYPKFISEMLKWN